MTKAKGVGSQPGAVVALGARLDRGVVVPGLRAGRCLAERLYLSPNTVNAHLRRIYDKLGVPPRTEAARFAVEHGLA